MKSQKEVKMMVNQPLVCRNFYSNKDYSTFVTHKSKSKVKSAESDDSCDEFTMDVGKTTGTHKKSPSKLTAAKKKVISRVSESDANQKARSNFRNQMFYPAHQQML